jgi:YD repeat-containing protein
MSLYVAKGGPHVEISSTELQSLLFEALAKPGERRHVLAVPPDLTRRDSRAGELTHYAYDDYGSRLEALSPGAQLV